MRHNKRIRRLLIVMGLCIGTASLASADRPAGHSPKRKHAEQQVPTGSALKFLRSMVPQAPVGGLPDGQPVWSTAHSVAAPTVTSTAVAAYPSTSTPNAFQVPAPQQLNTNPVARIAAHSNAAGFAQVAHNESAEAIPSFRVGGIRIAPAAANPPAIAPPGGSTPSAVAPRNNLSPSTSNPGFRVPKFGGVQTSPPSANELDGLLPFGVDLSQMSPAPAIPNPTTNPSPSNAQAPQMTNPFLREERVAQNTQAFPPHGTQQFSIPTTPYPALTPTPDQEKTQIASPPATAAAEATNPAAGAGEQPNRAGAIDPIPADAQIIYDSANPQLSGQVVGDGMMGEVVCDQCEGPCQCGLRIPVGPIRARKMGLYEEQPHVDYANAPYDQRAFSPNPQYGSTYNPAAEVGIYEFKWNQCSQRPLVELGRGLYRDGPVPQSYSFLGKRNLITPGFTLFGDYRTGIAYNDNGAGNGKGIWAHRLNLDFDLQITATERIHAFWGPLDEDGRFTRAELSTDGRDELDFIEEFDDDFDTLFFEGDLGYIWGGMTDQFAPFDLPFVAGKFPLLFQNGIWMNDAIEGFAFTLPARNAPLLKWSNYEVTFFAGFDDVDNPAFGGDDNAADVYGTNWFIEAWEGYFEIGQAYLKDHTNDDRSHHNATIAYTRRYRQRLSNSIRFIANFGQDNASGPRRADGQLLLIENSLVSGNRDYFVPYFNLFAGWGTPQSVARVGGILQNTGINFETDALTGFPKLDDRANDTYGAALGFNLLGPWFRTLATRSPVTSTPSVHDSNCQSTMPGSFASTESMDTVRTPRISRVPEWSFAGSSRKDYPAGETMKPVRKVANNSTTATRPIHFPRGRLRLLKPTIVQTAPRAPAKRETANNIR